MKLVRNIVFVLVIVLVMNKLGFLNDDASKKVDSMVDKTTQKVSELTYKGKNLKDMTLEEIARDVTSGIKNLKETHIQEDGFKFYAGSLEATFNIKNDEVLKASIDTSDMEAVKTLESLVSNITGDKFKLKESKQNKDNIEIKIIKDGEGYKIETKNK